MSNIFSISRDCLKLNDGWRIFSSTAGRLIFHQFHTKWLWSNLVRFTLWLFQKKCALGFLQSFTCDHSLVGWKIQARWTTHSCIKMQYTITFSSRIANPNCTVRGIMTITASDISRIQRNFNILLKVYERILAKKRIFSREVANPRESGFKSSKD